MLRYGKFGELSLFEKIRKEFDRHNSLIKLPEGELCHTPAPLDYIAVCAIIKDEGPYLTEWLEFHRLVGVDRFYLYDNGSTDGTFEILRPYIDADIVRFVPWPKFIAHSNPQYLAYAHAAALNVDKSHWLAYIDLDEFLFPVQESDLRKVFRKLEAASSIAVFRREFAFCGHKEPPAGPIIGNYNLTRPFRPLDRVKYKSVVKCSEVRAIGSAHRVVLDDETKFLDEQLERPHKDANGLFKVHSEKLRINHYRTKSEAEFRQKIIKGRMINRPDWEEKVSNNVKILERESTEMDCSIHRFLPALKSRLKKLDDGSL